MGRKEDLQIREYSLEILLPVFRGEEQSHTLLKAVLDKNDDWEPGRKAFLKKLTMGVLERKTELDYCLQQFLKQPVMRMKMPLRTILEIGAYQILYMDNVYDTKACDLCVELAKKKGFGQMTGLVNGVLRNLVRNKDSIVYPSKDKPADYLSVTYSVPKWMTELLLRQYDYDRVEKMLSHGLKDTNLCIHLLKSLSSGEKEEILSGFETAGIEVKECSFLPDAYALTRPGEITALPGFAEGKWYVQDYSSQLLGFLTPVKEGDTVLDACAAPGGKSIYLADKLNGAGRVYSCDVSEKKTDIIKENVNRMHLSNVEVLVRDATANVNAADSDLFDELSDGGMPSVQRMADNTNAGSLAKADVVLCDVPCSGLGVIGRKPDLKYRLIEADLESLTELQKSIVSAQVNVLKTGGYFVYSTCTVNKQENEEMAAWIKDNLPLEEVPFGNLPAELADSLVSPGQLQLLPGEHDCDGFYIALFTRV